MTLPVLPIRGVVMLPGGMMPFVVGRASSRRALAQALAADGRILLVVQRDAAVTDPKAADLFGVGAIAKIVQSHTLPDGNIKLLAEGLERVKLLAVSEEGCFRATVESLPEPAAAGVELEAAAKRVNRLMRRWSQAFGGWGPVSEEPGKLADVVGAHLPLTVAQKQELLETPGPLARLTRLAEILESEVR